MKKAKSIEDIVIGETYTIESIVKIEEINSEVEISWYQVGSKGCRVTKIKPIVKTKGMLVFVYKMPLGDCTANGMSSNRDQLILIGDGIPELFEGDETNTVKLVKRSLYAGKEYLHVEPISERPAGSIGPMCGGNFIYSLDSRFPSRQPISIHDRFEFQS